MLLLWGIREEYKVVGLRMLVWMNLVRNLRVVLRYSLVFIFICFGFCVVGVMEWSFVVMSVLVNLWFVVEVVKFWRYEGYKGSVKGLFWVSVWYLFVVMVLVLV